MDPSALLLAVFLWSNVLPVTKSSLESCLCHLHNVTLALKDKSLQLVESGILEVPSIAIVSRCYGGCGDADDKSRLVCRPGATALKTVTFPVPWSMHEHSHFPKEDPLKITVGVEEHKSCVCVDQNSINVSINVDSRLREQVRQDEAAELSREIRSVAPTTSNDIITTKATRKGTLVTNREIGPDGVTPTEHEIVYYKTCLACREQQDLCKVNGQVYDSEVCHCVYPASRTFLNSFYTLGVVMLTVMVCCFLVFGVQKGDENVLNSSRRSSTRRRSTCRECQRRRSSSYGNFNRRQSRRYSSRIDDVERSETNGLNNGNSASGGPVILPSSSCNEVVAIVTNSSATVNNNPESIISAGISNN